jgi:hypothetical protein
MLTQNYITYEKTSLRKFYQNLNIYNFGFWGKPHRMLKIIHCCGRHCSCHPQGEYVVVENFWKPYIEKALGVELYLMVPICGAHLQLD